MTNELTYISTEYFRKWFSKPEHRVSFGGRDLAIEYGNWQIEPPVMMAFYNYLAEKGDLFTQREFLDYFWTLPSPQPKETLEHRDIKGIEARISRQFYPSAMKTVHAWALLVESGHFDRCLISARKDFVGKVDLTVISDESAVLVAFRDDTVNSEDWSRIKEENVSGMRGVNEDAVEILLKITDKLRSDAQMTGNLILYSIDDLKPVFDAAGVTYVPKHTKVPTKRYILKQRKTGQVQLFDYVLGVSA